MDYKYSQLKDSLYSLNRASGQGQKHSLGSYLRT
jgi:hypothetical protein